jgi:translation initiation factor 4E
MAAAVNGDPSAQVDLSTIPISPDGANGHDENNNSNGSSGEEQITVFHDPDNFNVKHPLMNKWTLWFTKPPSGKVGLRQQHFTFNILTSSSGRQLERSIKGSHHL